MLCPPAPRFNVDAFQAPSPQWKKVRQLHPMPINLTTLKSGGTGGRDPNGVVQPGTARTCSHIISLANFFPSTVHLIDISHLSWVHQTMPRAEFLLRLGWGVPLSQVDFGRERERERGTEREREREGYSFIGQGIHSRSQSLRPRICYAYWPAEWLDDVTPHRHMLVGLSGSRLRAATATAPTADCRNLSFYW